MAAARGTSGSYYEDYMRSNAMLKHGGERNAKQLLTDRNAYISFLEVQLERVSAACLTVQTFEKRLAEVETTQLANDQKIGSLSKVLRLNQEYVEQTAEQSRTELEAFANKMDSWMEKYSTQLQTHESRITEIEEHMRHSDKFVETMSCDVRHELETLKLTLDSETQDVKTLVFAAETRLDTMQNAQGDTDQHMDLLQQLVSNRFEEDLERMRTSLSEKYVAIEEKHEELRSSIKLFASEMEVGWKTDLARLSRSDDEKWKRVHEQVHKIDQSMVTEIHEMKEFLRKCLDAQHLLSTTVVGLQAEVDENKFIDASNPPSKFVHDADMAMEEIEELRKNQLRLKEALRVIQACSSEAQQTNEAQYDRLVERLESAEQQFAALAHDSITKADDMRTKVLVALGEVEQKLRHDADAVVETAVQSVRSESKMYMNQFLDVVSRLEQRVDDLEHSTERIHINVPTVPRPITPREETRGRDGKSDDCPTNDIERITQAVARTLEKQMSLVLSSVRTEAAEQSAMETKLRDYVSFLEDRLRAEQRDADFTADDLKPLRRTTNLRSSPNASTTSLQERSVKKVAKPVKRGTTLSQESTGRKKISDSSSSKAKSNRMKELCLDLVAMERSLKNRRRPDKAIV